MPNEYPCRDEDLKLVYLINVVQYRSKKVMKMASVMFTS